MRSEPAPRGGRGRAAPLAKGRSPGQDAAGQGSEPEAPAVVNRRARRKRIRQRRRGEAPPTDDECPDHRRRSLRSSSTLFLRCRRLTVYRGSDVRVGAFPTNCPSPCRRKIKEGVDVCQGARGVFSGRGRSADPQPLTAPLCWSSMTEGSNFAQLLRVGKMRLSGLVQLV